MMPHLFNILNGQQPCGKTRVREIELGRFEASFKKFSALLFIMRYIYSMYADCQLNLQSASQIDLIQKTVTPDWEADNPGQSLSAVMFFMPL